MDDFEWRDKYAEAVANADQVHAETVKAAAVEAGYSRYKTLFLIDAWLMPESEKGNWFLEKIGQDFARAEFRALLMAMLDLRDIEYYLHTIGEDADIRRAEAGRLARNAVKQVWPLSAAEQKAEKNERNKFNRAYRNWKEAGEKQENFSVVPSSPHVIDYSDSIVCINNLADMEKRKHAVTHSTSLKTVERDDGQFLTFSRDNGNGTTTVTEIVLPGYLAIRKKNETFSKMFLYILSLVSEQVMDGMEIKSTKMCFTASDLVRNGMYATRQAAIRSIEDIVPLICQNTNLTIRVVKGSRETKAFQTGGLFHFGWDGTTCTVKLNSEYLDIWPELAKGFAAMPPFLFWLTGRPFTLLSSIFFYARMNLDSDDRVGNFTISMKAVQMKLNLPDIEGNNHPDRVVNQIEAAIQAIEEAQQKYGEKMLTITPEGIGRGTPKDYMQGCLRIEIYGRMKERLLAVRKLRVKADKKKKQREEKALEDAATQLVMERMKAAENPPGGTNDS